MTGQNEKCESTLIKGLTQDRGNFDIMYALFAFYMKQDNPTKAAIYIEQLKSFYPNNKEVQDLYTNFISRG
jgi:hypothetical protein